jgi:SsrA-binding protein
VPPKRPPQAPRILNKKARFNYEIIEEQEAGIALTGSEVKSLRSGKASLEEAYARIRSGELFLIGCNISPYPMATHEQHHPTRERRLLLHKRQIKKWTAKVTQRGLTLVPLALYFNDRGLCKLTVALARGKTHGDKRTDIKKREHEREMARAQRRRR